jgi:endonuclease/exonuclease/phosphatase (EEP) superfamily protein YafD
MLKKFLFGFGVVAIICTLIPFIPSDQWFIRMFAFPHIQLTALTLFAILAWQIKFDVKSKRDYTFMALLITCFVYQASVIAPFTPFYEKESNDATSLETKINVFTVNVLQKNNESEKVLKIIQKLNPDLVVFTEANKEWLKKIEKNLSKKYEHQVIEPLDNTYGMLLYSRYELIDPEVKFMVTDSIPSIHSKLRLPNGDLIQLYAVHPTPPMPQENKLSTDRDAELIFTAELARNSKLPVIVTGDFNDIPWSSTSILFQHTSELLDVRVGRGFYNTFNAQKFLFRWPLDHIYVSPEFRVAKIENCESINSDHFPFYVELSYEPELAKEQLPNPATAEELKQAEQVKERLAKKEKRERKQLSS